MHRRLSLILLVVTGLAAACTTEQSSDPRPTLTVGTTTTTTEAPVETTEVVETTAAPTTESSTTTSQPGPTSASVPIAIGSEGGWLALGAWAGGNWVAATDAAGNETAPTIATGDAVTISSLAGDKTATAGEVVEACFDGRQGPTMSVAVAAPEPPGSGYGAIATTGHGGTLLPRPVAVASSGPDTYRSLGAAIFAADPVDAAQGRVVQVVVADLDGDGDDEAVVTFEFIQVPDTPGTPGDFAALYVVDTASRTPATVAAHHVPADLPSGAMAVIERYRVIDVADLNGDGRMEVAVHAWYSEGAAVQLYEYDGTSLRQVLTAGCGA